MAGLPFPSECFTDPSRAARHLDKLSEDFLAAGSRYLLDDFTSLLARLLASSPDPDMALTNFVRFSEAAVSRTSLFNDLMQYPVMADLAVRIFGFSQYFADVLVRDPSVFRWMTTTGVLQAPVEPGYLAMEVERIEETFPRPERRLDALKRLHRRELVRIGAQDILGLADVASVTLQLSHLADVLADAVIRASAIQLAARFPVDPPTPFVVIGLGKLGGRELNYSSDIDVMFAYGEEGSVGEYTHHEYFNKLAERIVQNLSQPSAEGHLFRVDTRLRPESGAGPLARSLRSYLSYYESRGEIWERQMLLKARPVAGDRAFGAGMIAQLEPFVFPRTFFQHPADYVARIKVRIERATGDEENVKLMAGGIRDIEFIVQTLQLINAGPHPELRESNTLAALAALAGAGEVTEAEEKSLSAAYRFYRAVEHRLQTMFNTQTHILPSDERTADTLARRLGLPSGGRFREELGIHLREVRRIFDQVLSIHTPADQPGILAVMDGGLPEDQLKTLFRSMGFRDVRLALRNVRLLTGGSSLTDAQTVDARTRDAFRTVAPDLFREIGSTPDPDMTVENLASVAAAQKFPQQFYAALSGSGFRRFLLDVCKISPRFAHGLARDPLLLESLAYNMASLASEPEFDRGASSFIVFKNREEVRSGIRHVLGFSDFRGLTRDLSRLADTIVTAVVEEELKRSRLRGVPLVIFALGKYGTRELNFDADLDLMFICGSDARTHKNRIEDAAARMVNRLAEVSSEGRLYDVDTRLRPEGKSAPLVTDVPAYRRYLASRASLWERQSLVRIRPVWGEEDLTREILKEVWRFVYDAPLPGGWTDSIVGMRRKMETRTRLGGAAPVDVKLGEGGMADVEFLAQMVHLRYGSEFPSVREAKRVVDLLTAPDLPCISAGEREELAEAYALFRRLETALRITLEEKNSLLPEGERLEKLGRILDVSSGAALREEVASMMKRTRRTFLELSKRLAT
jgi:[glutamine synthetase] adenylyltransferase / [glutamine synthetase]-adenylyl-L-tyrosine phosphorylase